MFSDEQKTFITKFGLNGTFFAFFVNGCGSRDSGSGSLMSDVEDVNNMQLTSILGKLILINCIFVCLQVTTIEVCLFN